MEKETASDTRTVFFFSILMGNDCDRAHDNMRSASCAGKR